ncbi:UNKNOWN [Stylonychia lemnae]|uniref:Methyltransferase domain-containing protein n=1 Tax=Stylonychia lemnae TaxID=5949 RepID=A0A077ZU07_STYLE|nr:UNKNOWN [Stylonychia lemnae]|eukprot:CDW73059.1 UNKNOWN [Stylonychia lemnae]
MGSFIFAFFTVALWIWFVPLLMLLSILFFIQKGKQVLMSLRIVLKLGFFETKLSKEEWKYLYNKYLQETYYPQLDTANYGFAILSEDGIYLDNYKRNESVLNYQLYDHAVLMHANISDLRGKTLMDVSCGRGGGLRHLIEEFNPSIAYGVDISQESLNFSEKLIGSQHKTKIEYIQADAEKLMSVQQLSESSVDVLINIQSSHCYDDLRKFFEGVKYLLKEDGVFIYADFRQTDQYQIIDSLINENFDVLKYEDIRRNVFHAMQLQSQFKTEQILQESSWYLQLFLPFYLGLEGTKMYRDFEKGNKTYYLYTLRKKRDQS